jgi:hypothetical protein
MFLFSAPAFPQNLFESSQSGYHEELVSTNFTLGGFIRSAAYLGTDPESDHYYMQSAYGEAGLKLDARAGSLARATADIRLRYGNEFREEIVELDLREASINLWAGPLVLRAGKLITPWGKATVFNPTDKINPLDPVVRSPEEDDMLLGYWGMKADLNLGSSVRVSGTWKPLYRASTLLIDPIPMPAYVLFLEPDFPGTDLSQGSYGLHLDVFSRFMDLSLYWFDGYHHWPGIAFDSFEADPVTLEPVSLKLREKAYGMRMAGLDFSIPAGSWVIRAEGSWTGPKDETGTAAYIPYPELAYTAEIERSGTYLTVLAGYYGKYILDYREADADASLDASLEGLEQMISMGLAPSPAEIEEGIDQKIGAFNRLYNYQLDEMYHSVFLVGRLSLLQDRLELNLPVIWHLGTEEWILQPGVEFKAADGLSIRVGFSGMYGPENSLLDLVGPSLNAGYIALKLSF